VRTDRERREIIIRKSPKIKIKIKKEEKKFF
jgi:hypothetical protein